jgi:hypothetical protein
MVLVCGIALFEIELSVLYGNMLLLYADVYFQLQSLKFFHLEEADESFLSWHMSIVISS